MYFNLINVYFQELPSQFPSIEIKLISSVRIFYQAIVSKPELIELAVEQKDPPPLVS